MLELGSVCWAVGLKDRVPKAVAALRHPSGEDAKCFQRRNEIVKWNRSNEIEGGADVVESWFASHRIHPNNGMRA